MALDYSDFMINILEPGISAVTHVALINSSRLSVSLLAPQLCIRRHDRKKGIFVDGISYLLELQCRIKRN